MKKISLISDTHNSIHPDLYKHFETGDEIWHAGDIGSSELVESLRKIKPLKAVYGNIDGQDVRSLCPMVEIFRCERIKVLMIHIGGYPGRYEKVVRELIPVEKPDLFISGHSHILKVMYDSKYQLLHMNPGAAGRSGLHQKITMLQFIIDGKEIKDLDVIEIGRSRN
ncbi:metallophosphoesterase family protein [candidate division KSB1 bacterium]